MFAVGDPVVVRGNEGVIAKVYTRDVPPATGVRWFTPETFYAVQFGGLTVWGYRARELQRKVIRREPTATQSL